MAVWVDLAPPGMGGHLESEVAFPRSTFLFESVFEQGQSSQSLVRFEPLEGEVEDYSGILTDGLR
jgi:hypothetical protein